MIFFLDENFPKMAHTILGNAGHTVLDIRSTDKEGLPDNELFQLAKQGRAIFLTTDKDYYHTIHLTEKPHFGIIVIALRLQILSVYWLNWIGFLRIIRMNQSITIVVFY